MRVLLLAGSFLAGWSTCFVGWLLSREAGTRGSTIDLRDDVVADGHRHASA